MGALRKLHADHRGHLHRRLAGHRRRAAVRRLLVEGRDPASTPATRARSLWVVGLVTAAAHRLLHDPPGDHGLLRRGPLGRGPSRADVPPVEPTTPHADEPGDDHGRPRLHARTSRRGLMTRAARRAGRRRRRRRRPQPALRRARVPRTSWLEPVVGGSERVVSGADRGRQVAPRSPWPAVVALVGIGLGLPRLRPPAASGPSSRPFLANAWYYDEAVTAFMGGPGRRGASTARRLVRRATSSTAPSTASARLVRATARRAAPSCRAATSATTRSASASARSCCSAGSSSRGVV